MTRTYRWAMFWYAALAVVGGMARGDTFHRIPEADRAILSRVAAEYKLTPEQRRLLFAIRIVENGGPGRELGVLVPAAMRFKGNHAKSLELQGKWCAGTIRKRYTGDLAAFGARYCPPNAHPSNRNWLPNVRKLMELSR